MSGTLSHYEDHDDYIPGDVMVLVTLMMVMVLR